MSGRPPWIALAAAVALLLGLTVDREPVSEGSRTQQLRAADHSVVLGSSLRAGTTTARRDRAELGIHTAIAPGSFAFEPPPRLAIELPLAGPATRVQTPIAVRSRSRAPPRA